mmetsp:Transcript_36065/g.69166  ORF Transcript_36065/g.69166 Transcript_36065/m.69166 type:complete len:128 (-) Transcript_36065:1076-1459(-)
MHFCCVYLKISATGFFRQIFLAALISNHHSSPNIMRSSVRGARTAQISSLLKRRTSKTCIASRIYWNIFVRHLHEYFEVAAHIDFGNRQSVIYADKANNVDIEHVNDTFFDLFYGVNLMDISRNYSI